MTTENVEGSGEGESGGGYEMKDITRNQRHTEDSEISIDGNFDDWENDDEKRPELHRHRRSSTSTVQSFMLYTPDEERSIIRKFDRRLVLFVAFLYMLSFLDRSSMYPVERTSLPTRIAKMNRHWEC